MNEKQYVDAVMGKITCSRRRKQEFQKQRLADIRLRLEEGEELKEIFSQMGTAKEVAAAFQETVPPEEQKRCVRTRITTITVCVVAGLLFLVAAVYWMLPKMQPIEESRYFDKEEVEAMMKTTIEQFDDEDWQTLQEQAIPEMQKFLTKEGIAEIKGTITEEWGERKEFGAVYLTELVQENISYVVGEITVTYEKVSVIYRLTYDREMKLAGFYVR